MERAGMTKHRPVREDNSPLWTLSLRDEIKDVSPCSSRVRWNSIQDSLLQIFHWCIWSAIFFLDNWQRSKTNRILLSKEEWSGEKNDEKRVGDHSGKRYFRVDTVERRKGGSGKSRGREKQSYDQSRMHSLCCIWSIVNRERERESSWASADFSVSLLQRRNNNHLCASYLSLRPKMPFLSRLLCNNYFLAEKMNGPVLSDQLMGERNRREAKVG